MAITLVPATHPVEPHRPEKRKPMAYSDYNLIEVLRAFDLTITQVGLFGRTPLIEPVPWLRDALGRGKGIALFSEKSRCEFIVAPILLYCQEVLAGHCCVYSGIRLDVDPDRGLRGECDFLLGALPPAPALRAPLMAVVEAKKNDIEEGIGQCAAQLLGVRLFNEQDGSPIQKVYGCVTTGEAWQFLRLEGSSLLVDSDRFYIHEIDKILGIFVSILRSEQIP